MIINGQEYASVAIVDDEDYLLAVLSDNECICADNLKVIAESDDGGLVFQDVGDKRVKCFIRKDDTALKTGQMTTTGYIKKTKRDPHVKDAAEAFTDDMKVTKMDTGNLGNLLNVISKLPPEVLESALKGIVGNLATNLQATKKQEQSEVPTVEKIEVPESELQEGRK